MASISSVAEASTAADSPFPLDWAILLLYVSPNVQILSCVAVGSAVAVVLSAAEVIP